MASGITPSTAQRFTTVFPNDLSALADAQFPLRRHLERSYAALPFPKDLLTVQFYTQAAYGRGDIAAAAKVIQMLLRLHPALKIEWLINPMDRVQEAAELLDSPLPSNIEILQGDHCAQERDPIDLMVVGPMYSAQPKHYFERGRKIKGPVFAFTEIAHPRQAFPPQLLKMAYAKENLEELRKSPEIRAKKLKGLHDVLFPRDNDTGALPMGLLPGTGVLIDKNRSEAKLSRGDCCPSYLAHLQDQELKNDIMMALGTAEKQQPDYDRFSLNFGYAHLPGSWGRFIDCVAVHEKEKEVVIVLNQKGFQHHLSNGEFAEQVLSFQRVEFLKSHGYKEVVFKGANEDPIRLIAHEAADLGRRLSVIVRPSFHPEDFKWLQLASERLLSTGDNSAIEAWWARCKLFLYETGTGSQKIPFLQQQIDLALPFSPALSRLLALFGNDPRLGQDFTPTLAEFEEVLNDPSLSQATFNFCMHIMENYCFEKPFEAALKRAIWHEKIPELLQVEETALGEEFQFRLISYLQDPEKFAGEFQIPDVNGVIHSLVYQSDFV